MEREHGTLRQAGDVWQLVFTRRLHHPPERVWRALVEPDELRAWFPSTIDGERAAGATLRFDFDGVVDPIEGTMHVFDPPSVLELSWGGDRLRFELEPDGDGTVLTLIDSLEELGKAARDAAGWHVCLAHLVDSLDGIDPPRDIEWKPLNDEYAERFGPDAAAVGPPEGHPEAEPTSP
jgi:uncharacterized protein YndB with AHSA1/START domain